MSLKRSFLAIPLLGALALQSASAQTKDAPIAFANQEAITTTLVDVPNVAIDGSTAPINPAKWLKVEIHFGTTTNVTEKYPFVDAIQFKVTIEGFDLYAKNAPVPGKGTSIALTGDVSYVNVGTAKDLYGVVYVPGAVLARYSTRGPEDFDRKFNIHVEAYVDGKMVDLVDKRKETDPNWFKPLPPITGLVLRQDQSPFIATDVSRYPMLKPLPAPAQ